MADTESNEKHRQPGIRVDGAKRVDMNKKRTMRAAARKSRSEAPPIEDTRVSEIWARGDIRAKVAKRKGIEAKEMAKAREADGYKDGAVLSDTKVRLTATRHETRSIRCRPGTFEWRYGRSGDSALYHAGIRFAELWEIAGAASASSPDMESAGGGQWKGLPNGRAMAMDKIRLLRADIGKWSTARLVDYCVMGSTASEMARKYETDERAMAHVLYMDLRACAEHCRFL